jgi:hypothetical protein
MLEEDYRKEKAEHRAGNNISEQRYGTPQLPLRRHQGKDR